MFIDIAGRVNNVNLPRSTPLLPVLDAIVNSIDALEDCTEQQHPRILVHIERDTSQTQLSDEDFVNCPIANFVIEDNGPGFNDKNFNSFRTSDTTFKKHKGGKGIGRFLWLKSFQSVSIQSVYSENGQYKQRDFDFLLSADGVEGGETPQPAREPELRTRVHLRGFREEYEQHCPKKPATIAHKIIEHCLSFFLSSNCPNIILVDDSETIDLNRLFQEDYKAHSTECAFEVGAQPFNMASVKLRSSDPSNHRMYFCANNREVISEPLKDNISDLSHRIVNEKGDPFAYQAFISGQYLDANVNPERTDFNIPKKAVPLMPDEVTLQGS